MEDQNTILRAMAWNRAKGELLSMLETFWHDRTTDKFRQGDKLQLLIEEFIGKIEQDNLHR